MSQWIAIVLLVYVTIDGKCSQQEVGIATNNKGQVIVMVSDYQFHFKRKNVVNPGHYWMQDYLTKADAKRCVPQNYSLRTTQRIDGSFYIRISFLYTEDETYHVSKRGKLRPHTIEWKNLKEYSTIIISSDTL